MSLDQQHTDKNTASGYIVKDYTHVRPDEPADPMIMVIPAADILPVLDDAKKLNKKVAVYEIGQRVLDWT